ncbi:short chain type dehydrogenase [Penicillium verhagenii]|uniref:short chain type dehydrogenase n=1 Tax=Penicillium verhagenii TaxID=1562060 RepID=UPI0025456AE4|nr:short chain type dehydrogenase [Penicillium verhagenii]KAJ5939040.1 short chain type dehydrogenase [Penicillium verhagenii]
MFASLSGSVYSIMTRSLVLALPWAYTVHGLLEVKNLALDLIKVRGSPLASALFFYHASFNLDCKVDAIKEASNIDFTTITHLSHISHDMAHMHSSAFYPDLKDQIAVVIGAGQAGDPNSKFWGNGAAITKVLSSSGATIIACDKYGRIDILVNNVGDTTTGDPATMTEEAWDAQLQLNLKTVFLSCNAVLPVMEKQGFGAIINNASIAGMRYLGKPQVAYASAKAAVIHFTKVTGIMYTGRGVRVNSLSPGMMYTPLLEKLGRSGLAEEREIHKKITDHNVPQGSMGDAFDFANVVAFLASRASRYVTGQNLVVDGGLTGSTGTGGMPKLASKL